MQRFILAKKYFGVRCTLILNLTCLNWWYNCCKGWLWLKRRGEALRHTQKKKRQPTFIDVDRFLGRPRLSAPDVPPPHPLTERKTLASGAVWPQANKIIFFLFIYLRTHELTMYTWSIHVQCDACIWPCITLSLASRWDHIRKKHCIIWYQIIHCFVNRHLKFDRPLHDFQHSE